MTNKRNSGTGMWKKRLKRGLLLLAVPFLSALFLSAQGDTTVGRYLKTRMGIFGKSSYVGPIDYWFVRRVDGQYEVQKVQVAHRLSPEQRGLAMIAGRTRPRRPSGFWAPTRVTHLEWWNRAEFLPQASEETEYWAAMAPTHDDMLVRIQCMLDELIAHVPDRLPGLVETKRSFDGRTYVVRDVLWSGYIHNTIVLLCAGAGFFELGRAIRQRRRERSAGVQAE